MIVSLLVAVLLGTTFLAIGSGIYRTVGPTAEIAIKTETVRMTGIAAAFGLAAIAFQLNLSPVFVLTVLALLALAGLPHLGWSRQKIQIQSVKTFLRVRLTAMFAAAFYAVVMQGTFANSWTYRTGPDAFGWSGAALAICKGDTLSSLSQRVTSQLQGTGIFASFERPVHAGEISIAQISSFSDQVAAEFLIGAHRTGLPGILGSLCSITGESFYAYLFMAFILLSAFTLTRIIRLIGRESGLTPIWSDAIALAAVISVAPLSVTLEGGYGQFVTLPFFVLAISGLQRIRFDNESFTFSLALLGVAALSTYVDLLYLAGPMIVGIYLTGLLTRQYPLLKISKKTSLIFVASLALSWPMLTQLHRLIGSAAANPRLGGWDQGRFFLPDNIFGFFSNLPLGRYVITPRNGLEFVVEMALSAVVLWLIAIAPTRQRILGVFLLTGYLYLSFIVYSSPDVVNNYRLWKYSAYAAVLVSLVLIGIVSRNSFKPKRDVSIKASKTRQLFRAAAATLLASSLLSSAYYALDWKSSSSFTANGEDASLIGRLSPDYDLAFGPGLYSTMYTMFGDVRFATNNRGGSEVGIVVRDLKRPIAVVLPSSVTPNIELLNSVADGETYIRFTKLDQGGTITAYELLRD